MATTQSADHHAHLPRSIRVLRAPRHRLLHKGIAIFALAGAAALRAYVSYRKRGRTITDSAGATITYYRFDSGVITIKNKTKTLPDMWGTLIDISQDQPSRPGIIRCTTARGSVQADQVAEHGYPRPRNTAYRISIPLARASTALDDVGAVN